MTSLSPPKGRPGLTLRSSTRARLGIGLALGAVLVLGGTAAADAAVLPGNGSTAGGTSVQIPANRGVTFTKVSAGQFSTVALGSNGLAYAWGDNTYGQLGDGSTTSSSTPVQVQSPAGVTFTQVSIDIYSSVALGSDGNAYAWGSNATGELGDGTTKNSSVPVQVHAPTGVTFSQVEAGRAHSVALDSDGNAYSWGDNTYGQLGNGTKTNSPVPVSVHAPDGVTFTQLAAGDSDTAAIASDGNAYSWGRNYDGDLGNGSASDSSVPTKVQAPEGVSFTQISAGIYTTVALDSDGHAYAWGQNDDGELGNGTISGSFVPVRVHLPAGVTFTQVEAGHYYFVAVGSDGNTYAWGANSSGQLGDGTTTTATVPILMQTPAGVKFTQMGAGGAFTLAVGSDGNTYAWGLNAHGQLGDGTKTSSLAPVLVKPAPSVSVASVTFGGMAGVITGQNGTVVTVTTPVHASGVVDVVLTWSDGFAETLTGGYTFGTAPVITLDPASATIQNGKSEVLTAAATGDETPTVQWQVSTDHGAVWSDVSGATATSLSVNVVGQFRAVFTNALGTEATTAATLTAVAPTPPTPPTATPPAMAPPGPSPSGTSTAVAGAPSTRDALAFTGSNVAPMLITGLLLLLLGGGFLVYRSIRSRKQALEETTTTTA
jgi:alpha-tubulin suppressor-like RCC1 family protein